MKYLDAASCLNYFDAPVREEPTVGLEYELLGVCAESGRAMPFAGKRSLSAIFRRMAETGRYVPVGEGCHALGLQGRGFTVTLEPGCQTEFSSGVHRSLSSLEKQFRGYLADLREAASALRITWLPLGLQPLTPLAEMDLIPKERYRIMTRYLPTRGGKALYMMRQTAGLQAAIGYSGLEDAARKFRAAMSASSFVSAAFANSPLMEGRPNGFKSFRMQVWADCDPDRCLFLERAFHADFSVKDYVEYLFDVPLMFLVREGHWVPVEGKTTWRRFLREGFEQHRAEPEDWALQVSAVFPEVRLRRGYVEIRCMDSAPPGMALAAAAFWRGLLANEASCEEAFRLTATPDMKERMALHETVSREGLAARWKKGTALEVMRNLAEIAERGLAASRPGEEAYLVTLKNMLAGGRCPADGVLEAYKETWKENPADMVAALALRGEET